jgi:glyoxylase I family protein
VPARYAHTNLIARDWRRLADFYQRVFDCVPVSPERDLSGEWLERGTAVAGARLRGVHLRLPGHGSDGPTLEIFSYAEHTEQPEPVPNRLGYGHLAFAVDDVRATLALIQAHGGRALGEVVRHEIPEAGALTFVYARDPEGNVLEIQSWERTPPMPAREAYAHWAASYEEDENPTRDLDAAVLRQLLPDLAGKDVLELGCGTGKNTPALAARARSVTALDFSEAMLARARTRALAGVTLVCHDLRGPLPFSGASFDFVTCDLVLEHLPELSPLFAEIARVLRPGGELLVIELHPFRQLAGKSARFTLPDHGSIPVEAHLHAVSEYFAATAAAELRITHVGEWRNGAVALGRGATELPRLMSLRARRWPSAGALPPSS